jgi:hypothetical protein
MPVASHDLRGTSITGLPRPSKRLSFAGAFAGDVA